MTTKSGTKPTPWRQIWTLLWRSSDTYVRQRLALTLSLTVASAAITALAPVALKTAIDGFAITPPDATYVFMAIGLYVGAQWLSRTLGELRGMLHGQADRRMYRCLSDRLFDHVMSLPLRYHLDRQTGAVNETLANGLFGCQMVLQVGLYTLLPVVVQLFIVASVLVHLNQPVFMLMFVAALVLYAVAFAQGTIRITRQAKQASDAQVEAKGVMTDALLNYETVKYFSAEPLIRRRVDTANALTETQWRTCYVKRFFNGVWIAGIFVTFLAVSVGYAGWEVYHGRMTAGAFVLVNAYMLQLVAPMEMMGYAMQTFSQGVAFLQKMLELFSEKTEADSDLPVTPVKAARRAGSIAFEHVTFSYREDGATLSDICFKVPAGNTLGIVGSSGSGKTSLIRLLFRLYEPDSGQISVDGIPARSMVREDLRTSIAVVPQDTMLFNDTIATNIAFGKPGATQAEIEEAARVAHLDQFIRAQPEGYNTRVGERGLKLSGGEKQRVAIARAAIKRPLIYVFDEATSSLDSRTEREILQNLIDVAKSATTIVIAHRLSTVVHADEIIMLERGVIVERGTHAQLLGEGGRYAALWQAQNPQSVSTVPAAGESGTSPRMGSGLHA